MLFDIPGEETCGEKPCLLDGVVFFSSVTCLFCICEPHACLGPEDVGCLALELQLVVSCPVGAGNQAHILRQSNKYSLAVKAISSAPRVFFYIFLF